MKVEQRTLQNSSKLSLLDVKFDPTLILVLVSPGFNYPQIVLDRLVDNYPDALISGCSTSREIGDVIVQDNTMTVNFMKFDKTKCRMLSSNILETESSFKKGQSVMQELESDTLNHILVLSDRLQVNGGELIHGMKSVSSNVGITDGLAGDGSDFNTTYVVKQNEILTGQVVAIGLYGAALKVGYSFKGGWNSFGIEVARSGGSVMHEIDNKPALEFCKSFL